MRALNRVLALLLALALLAGGLLLAIEVAAATLGSDPLLVRWQAIYAAGNRDTWDSAGVRFICSVTVGVGLLILLGQLKPRRPTTLPLTGAGEHTETAVTRQGIRSTIRAAALAVDGISAVKVAVSRRKATVTAVSRLGPAQAASDLRNPVADSINNALGALQLSTPLRVKISVSPRKGARS